MNEKQHDEFEQEFKLIVRSNVRRKGIDDLMNWLDTTDFYTAPASSRHHGAFEGGLMVHSLNVYHWMNRLKDPLPDDTYASAESVALVALFHDLCKVGMYKASTRNVKNEITGQWEKKPCYTVQEDYPFGGHGSKSVYLVQHFLPLNPDEAAAINCHMGPWDRQDYGRPGDVYATNKLAWLLHVADEAATYFNKV